MAVVPTGDLFSAQRDALFSPRQDAFADIRIIEINIFRDVKYYLERLAILKKRERAISPLEVEVQGHRVHVTPLLNEMTSLHILRLIHPKQSRCRVDLFMRDEDFYFAAFRVEEVPSEEEMARGAKSVWSPCFKFNDEDIVLPDFLNVEEINLASSYGSSKEFTPGGSEMAMDNMFCAFLKFSRLRRINPQFKKAVYSVIGLYCEPRRLQSALDEMSRRIDMQSEPEEVSDLQWKRNHSWRNFGGLVLDDLAMGCLALENALPSWCHEFHKLSFMSSIIGGKGELLVIKSKRERLQTILAISDEEFNSRWRAWKTGAVHNPAFVI